MNDAHSGGGHTTLTTWMIIIAAAMAIAIGMSYFAYDRIAMTRNSAAVDEAGNVSTAGMKMYQASDIAQVQFYYPPRYTLTERVLDKDTGEHRSLTLTENVDLPENGEGPMAITVEEFQNSGQHSVADWVSEHDESNFHLSSRNFTTRAVGTREGIQYEWDGLYKGISVAVPKGERIFIFSTTYNSTNDFTYRDFHKLLQTVEFPE